MFLFSTKVTKKMDLDEVLARSQVQQHPNVYDGVNTFDITVPPDVDEDRFLKALEKDLRDYFASYPWDKLRVSRARAAVRVYRRVWALSKVALTY